MTANPPKNDAWPPYRGDQQRLVFVRRRGRLRPALGYVITWPISGTGGRFLVTWFDDDQPVPGLVTKWVRRDGIEPIKVDPNWLSGPAPWRQHRPR